MGFEKGRSGNPGGRPKKTDEQIKFERRCREWADTLGFDKLKKWAEREDPKVSLPALIEIFNRGFGRSVEHVEANVTSESSPSIADLEREAAELLAGGKAESKPLDVQTQVEPGK